MNVEGDINWIKQELNNVRDPHLIEVFKNMLKYRKKVADIDWWDEISNEEKSEIEEGIKQANAGELTSNAEMKKRNNKWL